MLLVWNNGIFKWLLVLFLLIHPLSIYISIYAENIVLYGILYCTYYHDRFNTFLSLLLGVHGGNRSPGSIPQILHQQSPATHEQPQTHLHGWHSVHSSYEQTHLFCTQHRSTYVMWLSYKSWSKCWQIKLSAETSTAVFQPSLYERITNILWITVICTTQNQWK